MGLAGYICLAFFGVVLFGTLIYGTYWDKKQEEEKKKNQDK